MPEVVGKIKDLRDSLEKTIEREDMERAKLVFAKNSLEGEKPTRFFCSLEKQMRKTTLLDSIMIQDKDVKEKECHDQGQIEIEVRKFYKDLYARKPTYATKLDILKYVGNSKIKQLTDEEVGTLEKEIEQVEVSKCLKNTRNNVAPGASGFTGSFYKIV